MTVGRISTNYAFIRSLNNINDSFWQMDTLREQLNTGKRINRPSDDPTGMQKVLAFNSSIEDTERLQRNINNATGRLNATSSALERVEDVLSDMIELSLTADSTASTSAERGAQAQQVQMLLEELVDIANTQYRGKYLFGGVNTVSGSCPLSDPYNIQYNADGEISGVVPNPRGINGLINTSVTPNTSLAMNISGSLPFQPNGAKGDGDVFNIALQMHSALISGNAEDLRNYQKQLESALENAVEQNTIVGARINRLEKTDEMLTTFKTNEKEERSQVEDADYSSVYSEYTKAELLLNTTLQSTASLLQQSLLNFI